MVLDKEWKVKYDSNNVMLVQTVDKVHDDGKPYKAVETYYYPNLKVALKHYLLKSLSGSASIMEVVNRIDKVEKLIKSLKL